MRTVTGSSPQSLGASQGHSRRADRRCWPVCGHTTGCSSVSPPLTIGVCALSPPAYPPTSYVPVARGALRERCWSPRLHRPLARPHGLVFRHAFPSPPGTTLCSFSENRLQGPLLQTLPRPTTKSGPQGSWHLLRGEPTALLLPVSGSPARAWLWGSSRFPRSPTCRPSRHFLAGRPALGSP